MLPYIQLVIGKSTYNGILLLDSYHNFVSEMYPCRRIFFSWLEPNTGFVLKNDNQKGNTGFIIELVRFAPDKHFFLDSSEWSLKPQVLFPLRLKPDTELAWLSKV